MPQSDYLDAAGDKVADKSIAMIAAQFIPIPGAGLIIGALISLAEKGKDEDTANRRVMDNFALNSTIKPIADATLAKDYDLAVAYFPKPMGTTYVTYYYDVSIARAPSMANAWYAAALGYALQHDNPTYLLEIGRIVDAREKVDRDYAVRDPGDASE